MEELKYYEVTESPKPDRHMVIDKEKGQIIISADGYYSLDKALKIAYYLEQIKRLTARKGVNNMWECFCDESYYHKWALRDSSEARSFYSAIHVETQEEAEFLVKKLNKLEKLEKGVAELMFMP